VGGGGGGGEEVGRRKERRNVDSPWYLTAQSQPDVQ
jgi:hypothetical protein